MTQTVLILGGSGRFGRHATAAFSFHGWDVRQFDRDTDDLWDAAWGADVIVNAWNPAYPDWAKEVPKLTQRVIEVAKATGATVLIPGNVYVFGPDTPGPWSTETLHLAQTPLGRIRQGMEAAYRAAGVPTILLRAGDFIDTQPGQNWFEKVITRDVAKGRMTYPGRLDRAHAWAFLPDLAEAAVQLAECRATLPAFADIPFAGFSLTGTALVQAVSQVMGRDLTVSGLPWWGIALAQPFWPLAKPLRDMRYLWDVPHTLDPKPLQHALPDFTPTPLLDALSVALEAQIYPDRAPRSSVLHGLCQGAFCRPQHG